MAKDDISYKNEDLNIKFNFRVALMGENNNKILLQHAKKDSYWSLIGGRAKLGESTKAAIIRETLEETGVQVSESELTLLRVVENFFEYNETKFHEILFIYKVSNKDLNNMNDFKTLDKEDVINSWVPKEKIAELDVRPEIVKSCINESTLSAQVIGL